MGFKTSSLSFWLISHSNLLVVNLAGMLSVLFYFIFLNEVYGSVISGLSMRALLTVPAIYFLGVMIGVLLIWPVASKFIYKINGYPFCVGDRVTVLVGDDLGKEGVVYEIWASRKQLRIDFGDGGCNGVEDVFEYIKVYKLRG